MRTLVDIPEDDIRWLDDRAARAGTSRAAVVRDAVSAYRAEAGAVRDGGWIDRGFGIWRARNDIGDAVEWQRRERASCTRSWDDDYEAVRAEFPDLFDAEDDRQHRLHLDMVAGRLSEPGER